MVIAWLNPDGRVTLSQRVAPREVMPTVDPSPPRVATVSNTLSSVRIGFLANLYRMTNPFTGNRLNTELWLHNSGTRLLPAVSYYANRLSL